TPIPEPEMETEDPETLRCFPGETRPADWMTIPAFAAREARALLDKVDVPASKTQWLATATRLRQVLDQNVLHSTAPHANAVRKASGTAAQQKLVIASESGVELELSHTIGKAPQRAGTIIVLSLEGVATPDTEKLAEAVHESGRRLVTLGLRATGEHAYARDKAGRAPDHNTAEWSLWLGRPLLGQWVLDLRMAITTLKANGYADDHLTVIGVGPAGIVALCAAALDERIDETVTVGTLASFVSDTPFNGQRLGILANGILRDVGDVSHIAALVAPRKLTIIGSVDGAGVPLSDAALATQFTPARHVYEVEQSTTQFSVFPTIDENDIVDKLN
ncbi:MAG: acetylxylan esterase, partial [Planctomycetota bacterium]|nr:acetylxylan esterase [Planctomycetota bacterium]